MKKLTTMIAAVLLLAACGQTYEETKRISRQQRREAQRRDSAALKVAVMPTLDCLPLFVAQELALLDTVHGGVRLKMYHAQMDCDTAVERGRVEGVVTDLVRAGRMERHGVKLRYVAATNAGWQLVANRNARLRQTKQLVDKMVAMTRHSATDLLTDLVRDSAGVKPERVFKVQINDLGVRMQMLQNNEMDALWMPEPLATEARVMKHGVLADTRTLDVRLGVMAFRDKEMARRERQQQLQLLVKAYDRACDTINKYGVAHFRKILTERYKMKPALVDSLPGDTRYEHCTQPRQQDVERARQWLDQLDRKGGTNGNQ